MERKGLLSRHVTFTSENTQYPSYALILIEGARIADIISFNPQVSSAEIIERYSEWNVEDLSEFYISPGIIDINVRREYEDLHSMTQAAIAGGVTFVLEEPGIYTRETDAGELFCDVGKVAHYGEIEAGCFAIKSYLYPPSHMYNKLQYNLDEVFTKVAEYDVPLIIDPNLPNPQTMYIASPYHLESLEVRFDIGPSKLVRSYLFAAAIPESIPRSDSDSSGEDFTIKTRRRGTTQDNHIRSSLAFSDEERSISFDNVQETASPCKDMPKIPEEDETPKKKRTIYDDLDARIKNFSQTIEALSLAEQFTYQNSGVTSYNRRTRSFDPQDMDEEEPPSPSLAERKKKLLDLAPIKTQVDLVSQETLYAFHLANFPEHWETAGLDLVLKQCKDKSVAVHICNISSAQALNKVRRAKRTMKNLTSEVGATHLFFTSEGIANKDTRMKSNCVIRNSTNYQLVWDVLKFKGIDCIASQHANIDAKFKDLENGNFQLALNGINSIGFAMQAVWTSLAKTATREEELEHYLVRLSKWMSKRPAEIIQIADHRGSIEKGKIADLVIWKPYQRFRVEELYSANPETSPFFGLMLCGKVDRVYLRGKLAFYQGQFKATGQRCFKK